MSEESPPELGGRDADASELLAGYRAGRTEVLGTYFERYRDRLRQMIALRMDRRIRGRVDASDVIQETFIEASRRLSSYVENPNMPLFVWVRFLAMEKLLQAHRRHLGAEMRDAGREISLQGRSGLEATSAAIAARLAGDQTSPSQVVMRAEMKSRLEVALGAMAPLDREVLALRHLEQVSSQEVAQILGIEESSASKRHLRALKRLGKIFRDFGGSRVR